MREENKLIQPRSQSTRRPPGWDLTRQTPTFSSDMPDPLSPTTLLIPNLQMCKKRRRITPPSGECITTDLWKRLKDESRRHSRPRVRVKEDEHFVEAGPSRVEKSSFVSCGPRITPERNLTGQVVSDDDVGLNIDPPPKNLTNRKASRSTTRNVVRTLHREKKDVQDEEPLRNSRRESNVVDSNDPFAARRPSKAKKKRVRFVDVPAVPHLELPSQTLPFKDPFSAGPSKPVTREARMQYQSKISLLNTPETLLARDDSFSAQKTTKKESVPLQENDSILPSFKLKGSNISRICAQTMDEVISGVYKDNISKKNIIDCRSRNEFKGGHIQGAKNISDKAIIDQQLFSTEKISKKAGKRRSPKKRLVLIFHCEFSAIRGPKMATYVREKDRELHGDDGLIYKEIYILDGGYAKYQGHSSQNCIGGYISMDSEWKRNSNNPQFDINQFKLKERNGFTKKKTYSLIDEKGRFNYLDDSEPHQSGPSQTSQPRESQRERKLLWPTIRGPSSSPTSR